MSIEATREICRLRTSLLGFVFVGIAFAGGANPAAAQAPKVQPIATEVKVPAFYLQRLRTAPPDIKVRIEELQKEAKAKGWTFPVAYTAVAGRDLKTLTGENPPTEAILKKVPEINAQAKRIVDLYRQELIKSNIKVAAVACNANLASWDWRTKGKVTPPKLQSCGDCWAFASAGQVESAFLMADWPTSDLSEQQILSCSNSGDCTGGRRWDALPWASHTAVATETKYPYEGGVASACKANIVGDHKLLAAGWIDGSGDVASEATIKAALCQYGPISVSIFATPALQHYGGGGAVFNENKNDSGTNHAILVIGWDNAKKAWLIKNSWGTGWGDGGYGWVHFGSNNIGRFPVWAQAAQKKLIFSPALLSEVRKLHELTLPR
ncbi:MAG: hypothetical protein QOG38_2351 [Hyphomicrobiales bacterium]|jgi:cathepsin L|nr:hypothetical protein [Hyphomicrobiales bacterium]